MLQALDLFMLEFCLKQIYVYIHPSPILRCDIQLSILFHKGYDTCNMTISDLRPICSEYTRNLLLNDNK